MTIAAITKRGANTGRAARTTDRRGHRRMVERRERRAAKMVVPEKDWSRIGIARLRRKRAGLLLDFSNSIVSRFSV